MIDPTPARWILRLESYGKAVEGVAEADALASERGLSELEKAGAIQRFEISWELGWKLMADYLADALVPPQEYTPTKTVRAAMAAALIVDGDDWIAAGRLRSQLSHTYDEAIRDRGLVELSHRFLPMLRSFHSAMELRAKDG